ncbi:MAG: phosphoketolase family protein [Nanoarchaeota archaeon]
MVIRREEVDWAKRYWNSANYIAAASIYLKDNFLMEKPLKPEHIKDYLLGHWGTCPGINFAYTHLNLLASKNNQQILLVCGPGHGFAAILANLFLENSLERYYSQMKRNGAGLKNVIKAFSWPSSGFPSHINPGTPGAIHEGGELGYALGTAFGAAFDNPDLIVAVIVGDGEAETGPTATAWHSNKFLSPKTDGAVLPILHLNKYKINSPTIYGTMDDSELKELFKGYGYEPIFVGESHEEMINAMNNCYKKIKMIQNLAREGKEVRKPRWPMIILQTRKGWTGVKELNGEMIEGNYLSHQVPIKDVKENRKSLIALEKWLRSYNPGKLFPNGELSDEIFSFIPTNEFRIGSNPHAIGGNFYKPLILPKVEDLNLKIKSRGNDLNESTPALGKYLRRVMELNIQNKNFRIFSPDELESNRMHEILEVTGRAGVWSEDKSDIKNCKISDEGKVMEMLSEHTLQSWMQGYVLTGRHVFFPSYEAFLPIVDSMISQYLKFIKTSEEYIWRKPIPSVNYLMTSVCWRQDHNGFSHQNPGFINTLLNKAREEELIRIYLPADVNSLMVTAEKVLKSNNKVNVIVADKRPIRQWLSYEEALKQDKKGASIWKFASDDNPDVILASSGDYQTQEALATIAMLKKDIPEIKLRFVNVSELNVLGVKEFYPNGLEENDFKELFSEDKHVIFNFHGYPGAIKQLLFDRPNTLRFHVYGYIESGTTTTPFDMLVRNKVSRYDLAIRLVRHAAKTNLAVAKVQYELIAKYRKKREEHREWILKNGIDPKEINDWKWEDSKPIAVSKKLVTKKKRK